MLVLDTECMKKDLQRRCMDDKNINDIVSRFAKYEGLEVRLYVEYGGLQSVGYIVGMFNRVEIPRGWCRYVRREVNHDSNAYTRGYR